MKLIAPESDFPVWSCMSDNSAFSLSDRPGKNIKDGLLVSVLSLVLGIFLAGEWLSTWMVGLFGILFLAGIVMTAIGVVRAIRHGFDGSKDRHLLSAGYRQKIKEFFSHHRITQHERFKQVDLPTWVAAVWFIGIFLGPGIGWLCTSSAIGDMHEKNWKVLVAIRAALSLIIPVGFGIYIILRYILFSPGSRMASLIFVTGGAMGLWSGWASAADLVAREPRELTTRIMEYQKRGYLIAPWLGEGYRPNLGPYRAKLSDGKILDFFCPRICLDHYDGNRKIILIDKPVTITYLEHLGKILEVEPTD